MATPIGAILCVSMLSLSCAVLGVGLVLTAICRVDIEESVVPAYVGGRPPIARSEERLASTAV